MASASLQDPTLTTAALAALETVLNRAVSLSPGSATDLQAVDGCVFALDCSHPSVQVYLRTRDGQLRLSSYFDGEVTTRICGDASDFRELALSSDAAATLINSNLELEGDSAPLITLQGVLADLDVDWEAPLVEHLGDVAGHQLAEILRQAYSWGQQASRSLGRQLQEFIQEEARLSPPRLELEDFFSDLRALDQRVERLQSRAAKLRRKLADLER
ncbi:MAG: SCP2 sterol-binding domain-containing protein [Pseudomonadota bacterium]